MARRDGPETLPTPVWSGEITVLGVLLHCHVLDDGSRIIEADDVHEFMRVLAEGTEPVQERDLHEYIAFLTGKPML